MRETKDWAANDPFEKNDGLIQSGQEIVTANQAMFMMRAAAIIVFIMGGLNMSCIFEPL